MTNPPTATTYFFSRQGVSPYPKSRVVYIQLGHGRADSFSSFVSHAGEQCDYVERRTHYLTCPPGKRGNQGELPHEIGLTGITYRAVVTAGERE